jgi:plastocyanin
MAAHRHRRPVINRRAIPPRKQTDVIKNTPRKSNRTFASKQNETNQSYEPKVLNYSYENEKYEPRRQRDIFIKIEKLNGYSPVASEDAELHPYRRDCMRNHQHEDSTIPDAEVELRRLDALVYREYLDQNYTVPNTIPVVPSDINEPRFDFRIPGALIYSEPGERLFVHVYNSDDKPHSLHVHGLIYGIDSDASWPFGVSSIDGRRSDEICPGQEWTYVFDVTTDTIGAWPFHDHYKDIMENVNRGLFGGIVVRDPSAPKADYEVPLFFHRLAGTRSTSLFDSGTLNPGQTFSHTFPLEGEFNYFCRFHPMNGQVRVVMGGPAQATVSIRDGPSRFDPPDVTIGHGGSITWEHVGVTPHTATESGGSGLESVALNGRTFVGNTPTIVAETGKRIRWYVFNLDLGMMWHNFHPHGQRWIVGNEILDVRSIGPAESFVADTIVPPVILLPVKMKKEKNEKKNKKSVNYAKEGGRHVILRGDFLVHCHVEPHMMEGMAAVVRAIHEVELSEQLEQKLGLILPVDDGNTECPVIDIRRCDKGNEGVWESLPDSPIFVVHAAVLHTNKVLLFSGGSEVGYPLESRVWDPTTGGFTTQIFGEDLFCSGHAFLADGRLCVAGGAPFGSVRTTHLFDPVSESWSRVADMNIARWYPTVLTLPDGRILSASGVYGVQPLEIYDPASNTWQTISGADRQFDELYPSLHLLPSGEIFYSRAGWTLAVGPQTAYLTLTGTNTGVWTNLGQQQFFDRQEGSAAIMIDASATTATSVQVMVIGGGVTGTPTIRNPQSCEIIDLSSLIAPPVWRGTADMQFQRTNVNSVNLPDGTILVIGGQRNGKWSIDPQPVYEAEIYDPKTDTWTVMTAMQHPRQYHSIAVLLPDGRVLTAGGVDPTLGGPPQRDQRFMEIFSPPYLFRGVRPVIATAPNQVSYGDEFDITTDDALQIESVAFLRPCAMTHHTDAGQRFVKIGITQRDPNRIRVKAPTNGNIAPPGYYMLFIVSADGVPSVAKFMRLL